MIRQPEREQINHLTVKTLDQVFIERHGAMWASGGSS
jgi:hypothetical protein